MDVSPLEDNTAVIVSSQLNFIPLLTTLSSSLSSVVVFNVLPTKHKHHLLHFSELQYLP